MNDVLAEFVGTFILVFAITATIFGAALVNSGFGVFNMLAIALVAGFSLIAVIYSFAPVSGAHFNPAVTIALYSMKRFPREKVVPYISAQILGGLASSAALFLITTRTTNLGATTAGSFGSISAFFAELVGTAILVSVILAVTSQKKNPTPNAGIAIGFALSAIHLFAIPLSGSSVNPARSIGPALFTGGSAISQLWIYILGPVLGALLAVLIYTKIFESEK